MSGLVPNTADGIAIYSDNIALSGATTGILTTGYQSISAQISGTWVGNMWFEGSNNNEVWDELLVTSVDAITTQDIISCNGVYSLEISTKYIRLNVLQLQSGTITALILGKSTQGLSSTELLSFAMDKSNNMPLYVSEIDQRKDINNALVPSDAPDMISGSGMVANKVLFKVDTTGYQSIAVQLFGTFSATVIFQASNDGNVWYTQSGYNTIGAQVYIQNATVAGLYIFACTGKFFRVQLSAYVSGNVQSIAYLRQQPLAPSMISTPSVNIAQLVGTAPVTAGVAGTLAVGGNIANGVAPTANPLMIAGIDTTVPTARTRRVLVDTTGQQFVTGPLAAPQSAQNVASVSVQDGLQFEGQNHVELLAQILLELRILTQQMSDLPLYLNSGISSLDEPDHFRNDQSLFAI